MDITTLEPEFLKPDIEFKWTEYIFFGAVLVASLGIGVFYGFFGKQNETNDEFLMAGRSMSVLPVTLSLVCSFVSAITLLGNPVEVYNYGVQFSLVAISFIPMTLLLMYIYVPVYFELQLTSAYEYFEWRFSRRVRMIISLLAIVHLMVYMPTTVYGPSLALDQVAGINTIWSCAAIFLVCIAYSSIGGLKAVLWTDALQALVMVVSLIAIISAGMIEGGFSNMWERAEETHRTNFFNFDFDPRTRHTFWTSIVAGVFLWIPLFAGTQAQIQRYNSVSTLSASRKTLLFNMVGLITIVVLCAWIGLILYAKYYDCDPIKAKIIDASDQMVPLFVMEVLGKYPVIPGLLVAGLTCGSLSSVSSALNSLSAIITEDFVKLRKPGLSETKLAFISKAVSAVTGIAAFGLVFVVAEVNKTVPIQPFSSLIHGSLLGPIVGAFSLGILFPWTEELGTLVGLMFSIFVSAFVGFGNIIEGRAGNLADQRLTQRTDGCDLVNSTTFANFYQNNSYNIVSPGDWKADTKNDSFVLKIWSFSYNWQPAIGTLSMFFCGMIVSAIIVVFRKDRRKVNASLLSKPMIKLWKRCFGIEFIHKWVDYVSQPYSGDPNEKLKRLNNNTDMNTVIDEKL